MPSGPEGGVDPLIWAAVLGLAAVIGFGGYQLVGATSAAPAAVATPKASTSTASGTPTATAPATPTVEQQALAALQQQRTTDAAAAVPQGQWVAKLASRYVGMQDPGSTSDAGNHTFVATDILAEHQQLRAGANFGAQILLVSSTDFGAKETAAGKPLWVTVATDGFRSANRVNRWCQRRFANLSQEQVAAVCTPIRLDKPTQ